MPFSYNLVAARASAATSPITRSVTLISTDAVLVVLLKVVGGTNRAGGALTWNGQTLVQANSTQKAATNPEASAELWYLLNPGAGTANLTIPNTGSLTIFSTIVSGRLPAGADASFIGANGSNNTATNPSPGAVTLGEYSAFLVAITAGGWTTWAPSAQVGTIIANTDDGADGGGEQYLIQNTPGTVTLGWTFATSDDWGAVVAAFGEAPAHAFNDYQFPKSGDGMGLSERIR